MMTLYRIYESSVQTRGVLTIEDFGGEVVYSCKTLELPWLSNRNRISCVPPKPEETVTYDLRRRPPEESASFDYEHLILEDVPGRKYILIHAGNLYTQILGCILVGSSFIDLNDDGYPDVAYSRRTLGKILAHTGAQSKIEIRWGFPEKYENDIEGLAPEKEPDPLELPDLSQLPEYAG